MNADIARWKRNQEFWGSYYASPERMREAGKKNIAGMRQTRWEQRGRVIGFRPERLFDDSYPEYLIWRYSFFQRGKRNAPKPTLENYDKGF